MTEEELKKIDAPNKAEKKSPTERQQKRNVIFLQLGGAALLFAFGCVLVPVLLIAAKYFYEYVLHGGENSETTFLSIVMFAAIVLAWFLSRQVCKLIAKRLGAENLGEETMKFYFPK